jgi:hypothetical protein
VRRHFIEHIAKDITEGFGKAAKTLAPAAAVRVYAGMTILVVSSAFLLIRSIS